MKNHPKHSMVTWEFESEAQRRAWELAVEWSHRTINQAVVDPRGFHAISKLASEGDMIAIGIMFQFTKARLLQP